MFCCGYGCGYWAVALGAETVLEPPQRKMRPPLSEVTTVLKLPLIMTSS